MPISMFANISLPEALIEMRRGKEGLLLEVMEAHGLLQDVSGEPYVVLHLLMQVPGAIPPELLDSAIEALLTLPDVDAIGEPFVTDTNAQALMALPGGVNRLKEKLSTLSTGLERMYFGGVASWIEGEPEDH